MGKRNKFTALMGILGSKDEPMLPETLPLSVEVNVPLNIEENVEVNVEENVPLNVEVNLSDKVADIVKDNVEVKVEDNVEVNMEVKVDIKGEDNVANNVHVKPKRWKPNPNSFEANYTRKTVFIRNDLYNLLDESSVYKGDITSIINEGLEIALKKRKRRGEKE